jgi:hypothetical protein
MRKLLLPAHARRAVVAWAASLVALGCQTPAVHSVGGASPDAGEDQDAGGRGGKPTGFFVADAGAGEPLPTPTCATAMYAAEKAPVDLLLLIDASDSMNDTSGADSKWHRVRAGLSSFIQDRASAGLGVGMLFFPGVPANGGRACQTDADCGGTPPLACHGVGACYAPGVPLLDTGCAAGLVTPFNCPAGMTCNRRGKCPQTGYLCVDGGYPCPGAGEHCQIDPGRCFKRGTGCELAQPGSLDVDVGVLPDHASVLVSALSMREPDGSTPMTAAIESAMAALATRRKTLPDRKTVMVLATDGYPSCDDDTLDSVPTRLRQAFAGTPSVPTYVVGVFAPGDLTEAQMIFQRFATAGGTDTPVLLTVGDDLGRQLLDALNAIRGKVVACDYGIPMPQNTPLDLSKINVTATSQNQPMELGRVAGPDQCAGRAGWYYAAAPTGTNLPQRIVLCPASCTRLKDDPAAHVDLVFGCATRIIQ